MLSNSDQYRIRLQLGLSRTFTLVSYLAVLVFMKLVKHYRISELQRIRKRCSKLLAQDDGPIVICANHLTLIDSMLIIWALSPAWRCATRSSSFPWNLPEKRNFYHNLALRALCYLGKCIPVVRQGPREKTRRVLDLVKFLLDRGESIMIFPEGGRSRTGKVDVENYAYGVGTILQESPEARVLCVYLRGQGQINYTDFPMKGEQFHVDLRIIRPTTENRGLRGARDLATQIIHELAQMEQKYFEGIREPEHLHEQTPATTARQ